MGTRASVAIGGVLALVALVVVMFAQDRPGTPRTSAAAAGMAWPALDEIQAAHIAAHLQFLADDLLEGRAPSTRGGQLAAQYLATAAAAARLRARRRERHLLPGGPVVESIVDPSFLLTAGSGAPFKYLQDVVAFSGVQDPAGA